jgi:hypothetical protein
MHLWQPDIRYPDPWTLDLPSDLAPGRYRVEIGLYELASGDRLPMAEGPGRLEGDALILDYLTIPDGEQAGEPAVPLGAELDGAIRLRGFSPDLGIQTIRAGDSLALDLHWQAIAPTDEAYTLFVHLVGADGAALTQHDGQPLGGFYPTTFWDAGEQFDEQVVLDIPDDAEAGTYQLIAGFYQLATGDRLSATGADAGPGDVIQLTRIQVGR